MYAISFLHLFNNIFPIKKRIVHIISLFIVTMSLLSISDISNINRSLPENVKSESLDVPIDTNKFVDRFQFSTWFKLILRSLFTQATMDDIYRVSVDSVPVSLTKNIDNLPKEIEVKVLNPEPDDTLSIFYRKYNERKNKAKGRKKKIWVDIETQNLIKTNLERKNGDTSILVKPINQSHANDLSFYLNNFFDSKRYKTELEWAKIQQIEVEPFFKKKIMNLKQI